jgi:hypothetical protein
MLELQIKFKIEAIIERGRVFGRGELQLFEECNFLKNHRLIVINFVGLGWICVRCSWGKKLVLELGRVLRRIEV